MLPSVRSHRDNPPSFTGLIMCSAAASFSKPPAPVRSKSRCPVFVAGALSWCAAWLGCLFQASPPAIGPALCCGRVPVHPLPLACFSDRRASTSPGPCIQEPEQVTRHHQDAPHTPPRQELRRRRAPRRPLSHACSGPGLSQTADFRKSCSQDGRLDIVGTDCVVSACGVEQPGSSLGSIRKMRVHASCCGSR